MANPVLYSRELFAVICDRIAEGEYLNNICKTHGMPAARTVRGWILDDHDGCSAVYARARKLQYENMENEIFEIANTPVEGVKTEVSSLGTKTSRADMLEHRKLQIETRRWLLAKLHPEKYGERKHVDVADVTDAEVTKRLVEARKRVGGA